MPNNYGSNPIPSVLETKTNNPTMDTTNESILVYIVSQEQHRHGYHGQHYIHSFEQGYKLQLIIYIVYVTCYMYSPLLILVAMLSQTLVNC